MSINKKLLVVVILLSFVLRFWSLAHFPVHLSIDEAAIGYSAYSILHTGKDEYGSKMPLAFRSVGDWKPPVLVYLMVPSIAIFGLNELGVRFPVALFGSLTPLAVFWLIRRLTKNEWLGLLTAFSVAISPWHIQFSRGSFEAIIALFFVLTGTWLFLEGTEGKKKWWFFSAIFFVLSMYAYHAERVFTPLLVLGLIFIYREKISFFKRESLLPLFLGIFLLLPLGLMMLGPEGQTRSAMTFIAKDVEISKELHRTSEHLPILAKVFDNNFLILGNFWVKRYLNYYDPVFLFFKGMSLTMPNYPDIGLFYLIELPFFFIGLWRLFFSKGALNKSAFNLIIFWWLLGPLPASLANNEQHPLRALTLIPVLQLVVALGVLQVAKLVIKKSWFTRVLASGVIFSLLAINQVYYFDLYYTHYPIQFSEYNDYGLKEISLYVWDHYSEYQQIVVDYQFGSLGPYITGVPHYYLLFYGKYNPQLYQQRPSLDSNDFAKFSFRPIYLPKDRYLKNALLIGSPWSLPLNDLDKKQILKKVYFKNGNLGFLVAKSDR